MRSDRIAAMENDPRKLDSGALEISAEGIKSKIVPSPLSGLKKPHEQGGTDEETRHRLERIEQKLDAILLSLKKSSV
jgi:hypothetical protein